MKPKTTQSVLFRKTLLASAALAAGLFTHAPLAAAEPALATAAEALQRGDLATAEATLKPLITDTQADPGALAQLAQVRLRQQRAAEAVSLLERAVSLAPGNAGLHAALGQALAQYMPEATMDEVGSVATRMLEAFQTAIAINPDLIEARVGLSRYYTQAPEMAGGSRARAMEQAHYIAQRVPWLGEAELGQIALRFEDYAAARDHFAKADELNPNQAWLVELRGHAAARLGEFAEARTHYAAALSLDPNLTGAREALQRLPSPATAGAAAP